MDTTTTNTITLDQVEALATRMEADEAARQEKLARLIRAYARILWIREPGLFEARARAIGDEAGHWDTSFPPAAEEYDATGPATIEVAGYQVEDVPTSSGYYYTWRRVTTDPGVYVDRAGRIIGADAHGTGRVGQYAAHPGDCDRSIEIDWSVRAEVTTAELAAAEAALRALAFPASAKLDTVRGAE